MTNSERLYAHARKDLGLAEVPGSKSHPRIELAIKTAAKWLPEGVRDVDGSIAWCGCIGGLWCLELSLPVPKAYYRAASWLEWGVAVKAGDERQGDVIVLQRPGGNHVALLEEKRGTLWDLLGGNQSNRVSVAPYRKSLVRGVRRAA